MKQLPKTRSRSRRSGVLRVPEPPSCLRGTGHSPTLSFPPYNPPSRPPSSPTSAKPTSPSVIPSMLASPTYTLTHPASSLHICQNDTFDTAERTGSKRLQNASRRVYIHSKSVTSSPPQNSHPHEHSARVFLPTTYLYNPSKSLTTSTLHERPGGTVRKPPVFSTSIADYTDARYALLLTP